MGTADPLERGVSIALAASAITIAAVFVYRQFAPVGEGQPRGPTITVSLLKDWQELLSSGRQVGRTDAPVQLVEFVDLECPGCQAFATTLQRVRDSYDEKLGVTFIHFPLSMHKSARQAARVAECGVSEGKFDALIAAMLHDRDSVGLNRWRTYGERVGIRDSASFRLCYSDTASVATIDQGVAAGKSIGIRATPTVIVNGWRFSTVPTERELRQTIDALLKGRNPPLEIR